ANDHLPCQCSLTPYIPVQVNMIQAFARVNDLERKRRDFPDHGIELSSQHGLLARVNPIHRTPGQPVPASRRVREHRIHEATRFVETLSDPFDAVRIRTVNHRDSTPDDSFDDPWSWIHFLAIRLKETCGVKIQFGYHGLCTRRPSRLPPASRECDSEKWFCRSCISLGRIVESED